jgi:Icc-related predicted phosphoesterase
MGSFYPRIFLILGNDDARSEEKNIIEGANLKLFEYIHFEKIEIDKYIFYGYSFTPPSPFLLKDWEKFDVSRYVDPGCISPNEGKTTTPSSEKDAWHRTMAEDINALVNSDDVQNGVFLFHAPPYKSNLDRAALDGKIIDHIPLDVHVGSIAVRKFIENKQPLLTLHGHIHESARITGQWKDKIGKTFCFSAAHDGKELALVKFDLTNLENAERILI